MKLSINAAGGYVDTKEVFVKDGGVWRTVTELHVKEDDTWEKIFPTTGSQTYTSGTSSFVVPQGVYSLSMTNMSGAGGGARSGQHTGDCYSGYPATAGATVANQSIAVTAGETLTVIVGTGGTGGVYPGFQQGYRLGTSGGATSIKRGATVLHTAAGGVTVNATFPSGTNFATAGPTNGTGFGKGGAGAACEGSNNHGDNGGVVFTW